MRVFVLLAAGLMVGCAGSTDKCGNKVLLLWPNRDGVYKFQEVLVESLKSPYELRGSAAEIYFEAGLNASGFEGGVARPHLARSGDVCVPKDTASALAFSAYAQFEHLHRFERRLGIAGQLSWPRKVGVDIHLRGDPTDTHNNAHYYGAQDVIALVPYSAPDLPITFNHGIVAHEHFHAHFQRQVINAVNLSLPQVTSVEDVFYPPPMRMKPVVEDLEGSDPESPRGINNFIMRGWNEGLADFFAAVYTGRSEFFADSMGAALQARRLDQPLMPLATAADYDQAAASARRYGATSTRVLAGFAYRQGSLLARLLYALANSGSLPPEEFLAHVMSRLERIPGRVIPDYARVKMDSDLVLPVLLEGVSLNSAACASLGATAGKATMQKGFPSCAGL